MKNVREIKSIEKRLVPCVCEGQSKERSKQLRSGLNTKNQTHAARQVTEKITLSRRRIRATREREQSAKLLSDNKKEQEEIKLILTNGRVVAKSDAFCHLVNKI